MNWLLGLVPLAALVAEVVLCVRYARNRADFGDPIPTSSWVWASPSALVLCFLAVWGFLGLVEGSDLWYLYPLVNAGIAASGVVALRRDETWELFDRSGKRAQIGMRIALVVALLILCLFAIEAPFNDLIPFGGPRFFWLEMLLVALLLLGCYLIGQRHAGLCVAPVAALLFIGIAQYFVKRFKNAAILPTDLFALGTAAAVSSEYVFALDSHALVGIACAAAAITVLSFVRPPKAADARGKAPVRNLAGGIASLALLTALVLVPYQIVFGVGIEYWYSMDFYRMQGFLPTFITVLQDMPIKRPQGYSPEHAQQVLAEHAQAYRESMASDPGHQQATKQFEELRPSVVAIMNESFADLSLYDNLHAGYTGPEFLNNELKDALATGTLNVSVFAGGTCNSEFEFLTGNSVSFVGQGKYPYSIYDLSGIDGLAADFKALGYRTCAIHPNYPTNWKRDIVYPLLGFDTFLSIYDFGGVPDTSVDKVTPNEPHSEVFHSGVSDAATYRRILDMLKEGDEPQFFFDVTMANHGSYQQRNIPEEYLLEYHPKDHDELTSDADWLTSDDDLNEYLSCIKRADDDLKAFLGELRKRDRPTVVIFFGDHQPRVSKDYNDTWYPNEDEDAHARRLYSSNYMIWANYDVAGRESNSKRIDTSVDMLGIRALDLIGAPTTDYQAAVLDITKQIPSLSITGYQDASGAWHKPEDTDETSQAYADLAQIEYLNFGSKVN